VTVPETSVTAPLEGKTRNLVHKTEDKTVAGGEDGTRVPPNTSTPEEEMETGEESMWDLQQFVERIDFAPQKHKQRIGMIEY
jgi:hypothetical protein